LVVTVETCPQSHSKVSTSAFGFSECGSRPTRRMVRLHPGQSGSRLERAAWSGVSGIIPKRLREKGGSRKLGQFKIQIRTRASKSRHYRLDPTNARLGPMGGDHARAQELAAFRTDAPYDYRRMHSGAPRTGFARPEHVEDCTSMPRGMENHNWSSPGSSAGHNRLTRVGSDQNSAGR
jgi:hypothetical protein